MLSLKEAIKVSQHAATAELRKFGLVFSGVLVGLFFLLIPWLKHRAHGSWAVFFVGAGMALLALALPKLLRPVHLVASLFGAVMGAVNNRVLLSLVFFLILWPIAVMMRWVSKADPMKRGFEPALGTYRVSCAGRDLVKNKEKMF